MERAKIMRLARVWVALPVIKLGEFKEVMG